MLSDIPKSTPIIFLLRKLFFEKEFFSETETSKEQKVLPKNILSLTGSPDSGHS